MRSIGPAVTREQCPAFLRTGLSKKEYAQRRLSPALEDMLENRRSYAYEANAEPFRPVEGMSANALAVSPIISNGDISGAVAFMASGENDHVTENQSMLCKAAAMILAKQIES